MLSERTEASAAVLDPARLAALKRTELLDTPTEEGFDRLTRLTTRLLGVPIALVSLVDEDRQFFKSAVGPREPWASARQTPLTHSFCQHVVATAEPLILTDAREEPRFAENPAIRELGVVAYAGVPLIGADGQVLGTLCAIDTAPRIWCDDDIAILQDLAGAVMSEINLRTRAREAAATEDMLRAVLEAVPIGIICLDARGQLAFMNEVGRQISGTVPAGSSPVAEQAAVYTIREPGTNRPLAPEETPIARALHGEQVEDFEYLFRQPNQPADILIRCSAAPFYDASGTITGAIAVFADASAEYALEQQKRDFLVAAAHDLRTPLTAIKGYAQLLQRYVRRPEPVDPTQLIEGLARIDETSGRMAGLVDELLDVTRHEMEDVLEIERHPVDLVDLVQRVCVQCHNSITTQELIVDAHVAPLMVMGDAPRLERIVSNLISNAIKYSPEGGSITVYLDLMEDAMGAWAILSIRDEGIGIPAADLPNIFDRFHRGENVADTIAGTGIGLASVKQIVGQHDGTVTVESQEGHGSTFTVRLPLASSTSE